MKRLLSICLILAILAALAYLAALNLRRRGHPLDFLPAGTVGYLSWNDPAGSLEQWRQTRLASRLAAIRWPVLLAELGLDEEQVARILDTREGILEAMESPLVGELLSQETVLALLEPSADAAFPCVEESLLLICRPRHQAGLLEFLTRTLARGIDVEDRPSNGGGGTIRQYRLEDGTIFYTASRRGLVLAALRPAVIERALAQEAADRPGLARAPLFARLYRGVDPLTGEFLFLHTSALARLLQRLAAAAPAPGRDLLAETAAQFQGLGAVAVRRRQGLERISFLCTMVVEPDRLPEHRRRLLKRPNAANPSLGMFGPDLLAYFWSNHFDPLFWWRMVQARKDPDLEARVREVVRRRLDLEIEDLPVLFGEQYGVVVREVGKSLFLPVPELCLFAEVADFQRVNHLLARALWDLAVTREQVGEVEISSALMAGGMLQPSYAHIGPFLVVADNKAQLEAMIRQGERMPLAEDPDFKAIGGLNRPGNTVLFVRLARLLEAAKGLLRTVNFLARDWSLAGSSGAVLSRELLLPLFDGLQMYRVLGLHGSHGGDEVRVSLTVLTDPGGSATKQAAAAGRRREPPPAPGEVLPGEDGLLRLPVPE